MRRGEGPGVNTPNGGKVNKEHGWNRKEERRVGEEAWTKPQGTFKTFSLGLFNITEAEKII